MKKALAEIEKLDKIKSYLVGTTDDIFDDGRDSGDDRQYARFVRQTDRIRRSATELSHVGDSLIPMEELDQIWRDSWNAGNPSLPENQYIHHMEYIESLRARLERLERDETE